MIHSELGLMGLELSDSNIGVAQAYTIQSAFVFMQGPIVAVVRDCQNVWGSTKSDRFIDPYTFKFQERNKQMAHKETYKIWL